MSQILACGEHFSDASYEADPGAFSALLARAKNGPGHALCRCTSPAPKLVIRCKHGPDGDRYYLAAWPNCGSDHNSNCRFFVSSEDRAKTSTHRLAAIQEDEGGFSIKPNFSLSHRLAASTGAASGGPRDANIKREGPQRDAIGLLGVLEYLWRMAGLNRNPEPKKRMWWDVAAQLANAAAQGEIGKTPLSDVLYIVPPFEVKKKAQLTHQWNEFTSRFHCTTNAIPTFLLLGEIKAVEHMDDAIATHLRHHAPPVYMSNELARTLAGRHLAVEARLNCETGLGRVIGLFQVEVTSKGNFWVTSAALMLVSDEYFAGQPGGGGESR